MKLSDYPGAHTLTGSNRYFHVPFSCFLRIVPIRGKRFETVHDEEKAADWAEQQLEAICSSEGLVFDFTKPVAFTPQFGDKTARLSFHGHACRKTSFTKTPIGERRVINTGEYKTGPGAANASNRIPDPELDTLCKELKAQIETATGYEVIRLELARFIYGVGGEHFPL